MRYLFVLLMFLISCGFEKDMLPSVKEVDTKYKLVVTSPCSFHVQVSVSIPDDYAHYRKDTHQLTALFGEEGRLRYARSQYSSWNNLSVNVPCVACTTNLNGIIYLLDDRIDLIPWGCGSQRPPLQVNEVYASFIPPLDAPTVDKKDTIPWSNEPPKEYNTTFVPVLTQMNSICDGNLVLFDLQPACKVLIDSGVVK